MRFYTRYYKTLCKNRLIKQGGSPHQCMKLLVIYLSVLKQLLLLVSLLIIFITFQDAVQLQSLIESALLGPNEKEWKAEPRDRPEEFEKWLDAVFFSDKATSKIDNWKDKIFPLVSTRKPEVLENLWKTLNLVCIFLFIYIYIRCLRSRIAELQELLRCRSRHLVAAY